MFKNVVIAILTLCVVVLTTCTVWWFVSRENYFAAKKAATEQCSKENNYLAGFEACLRRHGF